MLTFILILILIVIFIELLAQLMQTFILKQRIMYIKKVN